MCVAPNMVKWSFLYRGEGGGGRSPSTKIEWWEGHGRVKGKHTVWRDEKERRVAEETDCRK